MNWLKLGTSAFGGLMGVLVVSAPQLPAEAIVINDIRNNEGLDRAASLGFPFAAVTDIFGFDRFGEPVFCTGVLIDPAYVLTAQHCMFDIEINSLSVGFYDSDEFNTFLFERFVDNIFELDDTNNLFDGTDLAVLELDSEVNDNIKPLRFIADDLDLIGSPARMVGFGFDGLGSTGHDFGGGGFRFAADNVIDSYGELPLANLLDQTSNLFAADFDDGTEFANTLSPYNSDAMPLPNEGITAPGDSGGPLLVNIGNEFLIAGITAGGNTEFSTYGSLSAWTGTNQHREFLETYGGQFVEASASVPEPSTTTSLLMLGALGTAASWYRKHRWH